MPTILNVLNLPDMAGTERMFLQYAHILADAGHDVLCLVPPHAKAIEESPPHKRIRFIEDKHVHLAKGGNPFSAYRYRKLLKQHGVKLVFAHSGGLTRLFRKACKGICPVVSVNHNTNPKQTALADYAIATGRPIREQLVHTYGMTEDRARVLLNYIDFPAHMPEARPFRTPPVIGTFSRAEQNKRMDTFLHTLAILRREGIDFRAIVGGDGSYKAELERLCTSLGLDPYVTFIGWVKDKKQFFDSIDIFAFCSMSESFPLAMLEAIRYNTPMITSAFAGAEDMVFHEETGLVFPCGSAETLAQFIKRYLSNENYAHELAKHAFDYANAHFSTEVAKLELIRFVDEVLQPHQVA